MGDQVVFLIVAFGMIGLGLYFIFGKKQSQKSNRLAVEATIVEHVVERDTTSGGHPGQSTTISTFPVYEYQINGRDYRIRGNVGITVFTKEKCKIGAVETILVDPDNPRHIFTCGEKNATAIIGGILVGFGLLTFLFTVL